MLGISSFDFTVNSSFSLTSEINDQLNLEIGPASDDLEVNLLGISYLIISVFPDCGSCGEFVVRY